MLCRKARCFLLLVVMVVLTRLQQTMGTVFVLVPTIVAEYALGIIILPAFVV